MLGEVEEWRGSRRCYGSAKSNNGALAWVSGLVAAAAFSGHRSRVEEKNRGREWQERESERGVSLAFISEHTHVMWRGRHGMHATRWPVSKLVSHVELLKISDSTESASNGRLSTPF
jgi:hypothetical protein